MQLWLCLKLIFQRSFISVMKNKVIHFRDTGIRDTMMRLSVDIENVEDLIVDIE
jgi:O-acetylhomoserine/O-acetylserine sulfhydrylase-like pyridoxal-dependent enzyme